jgi:phosphatidate cytidylyltransferase
MLGARVASAAVLIPVVLFLLWLGPETTAITTAVASVVGAYEFYTMAARSPFRFRPFQVPGYIAAAAFSLAGYYKSPLWMLVIIVALAVIDLPYAFFYLPRKTPATGGSNEVEPVTGPGLDWLISFFGPIYVGLPLGLVALIRHDFNGDAAIWWVVLICLGTWGADTGGYFFGRFFGKHKLAPKISPKKTVEGAIGGVITATIGVALVGGLALNIPLYWTVPLGIVLAIASILGDLFESWIKRRFDTKDSGKLIPGHGGLLDRIDSFLAVSLVTYLFILFYH